MNRVYNFAPGPSMLATEVLEKVQKDLLCYGSTGMSVMEMSHRSKMYLEIFEKTVADFKDVMGVPEGYKVMFLQGGATAMFSAVPLNLMQGGKADYIDSGNFAHNALVEAQKYGEVNVAGSSREDNYTYIPDYTLSPDARYVHITTNNTIYGTRYDHVPDTGDIPLVADMSSNILSEVYDVSKFGVIYAGAQKNVAPAGVVILVVREDLLGHELPITPKVMSFKKMADADSMLNTPNCFGIYVAGLTFEWLKKQGGVAAIEKVNIEKANLLYDFLDNSKLFRGTAQEKYRSRMNVTFVTGDADKDAAFVKEATARGLVNLKGHRIVGGMRASIYNAMPMEGVKALVEFMKEFEMNNK
ncbi:MAG: 3-phosphoserine/phosphohydroxythreonine transaminase [Candidatus Ventricola sp.]|nr:3-phosphoserine/phosphohydroxythreonine transaminase [Clostridiales bacterium]MDY3762625.1 3-phosphoserine/phosphohydroxythreonine transaminase [Candidatus Ventricola sp.]MDY4856737.1 3-phosphoserine/phosphohydroxythreonine transaminase [Candidatus Ventricola sp.]